MKSKETAYTTSLEKQKPRHFALNKNGIVYWVLNQIIWFLQSLLCILTGILFKRDKSPYLRGNFAPTKSEIFVPETELNVIGVLPESISGSFIRNTPQPMFSIIAGYHWFDGDGKIHGTRIHNGRAVSYTSHWVQTARLKEEQAAGYAICGKIGDCKGYSGLLHLLWSHLKIKLGVIDSSQGLGTANTAFVFHADRLLALHEGDFPYWIRMACNGLISTIERCTFDSQLQHAFTAHPKVDPITKELFAFGYSVKDAPYCWLYRFDPQGTMTANFAVPLKQPAMMHDFAITAQHTILIVPPLLFSPEVMIKKGTLPFTFDNKSQPTRFGVLPRDACCADNIKWFTIDGCMIFHVANAWQSRKNGRDIIELYCCMFHEFSLDDMNVVSEKGEPKLTRVVLDLTTGEAMTQQMCSVTGDFPTIPVSKVGYPTKYTYIATFDMDKENGCTPRFYGVAKVDLTSSPEKQQESVVGLIKHGHRRYGGECYFVPKKDGGDGSIQGEEDDGYLMTYVYDEHTDASELVVYDAKTMSSDPVARVLLPERVPFGFHSYWVSEGQMKSQLVAPCGGSL